LSIEISQFYSLLREFEIDNDIENIDEGNSQEIRKNVSVGYSESNAKWMTKQVMTASKLLLTFPPNEFASNGTIIGKIFINFEEVACLGNLYKIFERC
jgi:hypothetical protein